jgi:pimeloyl-ACP methyl ester carboxylesterase
MQSRDDLCRSLGHRRDRRFWGVFSSWHALLITPVKTVFRILRVIFLALLIPVLLFLWYQSRLIYYPQAYYPASRKTLEKHHGTSIEYQTSQGKQIAFYVPPRSGEPIPLKIWVCFAGNGSLAMDWLQYLPEWDARFGYLLVDYPGYGDCQGSPTPGRIRANGLGAATALAARLPLSKEEFQSRLAVLGHSIGCASALMVADDLDIKRLVLIAPFTTLTDVARRVVGWPVCYLNLHRFDNLSHLASVCDKGAKVTIFHGTKDEIIPVSMSRALAAAHRDAVTLHEEEGQDHNYIIGNACARIGQAMTHAF